MTDKLVIGIQGILPDKKKHAILAAAEEGIEAWVIAFFNEHKIKLDTTVRAVKGKEKAVVAAVETEAVEEATPAEETPVALHPDRHRGVGD